MLFAIMTILPMLVSLFWGVFLILDSPKEDRAKKILTVFMFTATLLYFCHCTYFHKDVSLIPYTDTLYTFATLAVYPLYYLYIIRLTSVQPFGVRGALWLAPSAICFLAVGALYLLMPSAERTLWVAGYLDGSTVIGDSQWLAWQDAVHKIVSVVFAVQIVPIVILGSRRIMAYNRKIRNYYSNTEGKTFSNITTILYLFVIVSISSLSLNFIGKSFFAEAQYLLLIPSLLFAIMLYAIGYVSFRQRFTMQDYALDIQKEEEGIDTAAFVDGEQDIQIEDINPRASVDKLAGELANIVETEQLFLSPNLKISDLTSRLGTNRTYISQAINNEFGISFNEWINRYRVEYAKKLMTDLHTSDDKIQISLVCNKTGFSSESSFFRTFKQITGVSPLTWLSHQTSSRNNNHKQNRI